MALIALFDPFDGILDRQYATLEEFVAEWDRRGHARGGGYVYAFRDAAGSAFYVGKGSGDRAYDAERHNHGRLGYYVAKILGGPYTVQILKGELSADDAEELEALLIQKFGRQLVNWAGQWPGDVDDAVGEAHGVRPSAGSLPTYAETRECAHALRKRARAAADRGLEEAVSVCRGALAHLSEWARANAEAETRDLERRSATDLGARVDLHMARHVDAPCPPVPACDILSDLTTYLCRLGRAEEARREVDAFAERYPHGSFHEYEAFDRRSGRSTTIPVAKREQATLRRVERAFNRDASKRT